MIEEFRDVIGYNGYYQISNLGNVKSLKHGKEKILKPGVNTSGYLIVCLSENAKLSTKRVHQLVAMAFLGHTPNGYKGLFVDHVDNVKNNNTLNNLQLISNRENSSKDKRERMYSKYIGITYNKMRDSWGGTIRFKGKVYRTKSVKTEDEAYELYKELLNKLGLVNYN